MIDVKPEGILLNQHFQTAKEAIIAAGELLVAQGLVEEPYIQAMLARQEKVSVYVGNFVALPHGDIAGRQWIKKEGICVLQVPDGVNFGTEKEPKLVTILFAVALKEKQLALLQELAFFCSEIDNVMALSDSKTAAEIVEILRAYE